MSKKYLNLKSQLTEINKIEKLIESLADKYYLNDTYFANIMVAVTEAFYNALQHGNKGNQAKNIIIEYNVSDTEIIFEITDQGDGFDYVSFLSCKRKENQRGIELIQRVSDFIEFKNKGRTIVIHFNIVSLNNQMSNKRMGIFNNKNISIKSKNETAGI